MTPKTSKQLREEIEAQQEQPATEGTERTAEGIDVPTPKRKDFFGNLEKVVKPDK
jgi:hypothetical protein